jgi:hypothetical protein
MSSFRWFQDQPLASKILFLVMSPQSIDNLVGNVLKVGYGKSQDGGASAGKAYAKEPGRGLGRHGLDNFIQARNESLAVWLVDSVLHSQVDEFRIWWRLTKGNGKQSYPLQIEDLSSHRVSH